MKTLLVVLGIYLFGLSSANAQPNNVVTAYMYLQENELAEAKTAIEAAMQHDKTKESAKTWYYGAKIYMAIHNECDKTESAFGGYPADYYLGMAKNAYYKTTTYDMSRLDEEKINSEYQMVGDFMLNQGVLLYNESEYNRAAVMFEGTILVKKDFSITDSLAIYNAALAHEKAGNTNQAIGYYQKCIDINYKPEIAYYSNIMLLKDNGAIEKALKLTEKGRERFPENANLIVAQINLLLSLEKYEEALFTIDQGLLIMPNNADLYFSKGTLLESSNPEESIKSYKRAIEINPEYINALYNLGALYYNQAVELRNADGATNLTGVDELKTARKYLKRVESLSPGIEAVQSSLLMIQEILKD